MSGANQLLSELIRTANSASSCSAEQITKILNDAVDAIWQLRQATNIVPIPGRDALIYVRTVAAGADKVPAEEWRHALLHAAEMIRDLAIVIDSGTIIHITNDVPDPTTSLETAHD